MDHKIGEIVTLPNGRRAEVVEGGRCEHCALWEYGYDECYECMKCMASVRTDHKNIIYKEIKEE